jgi:PAS domain S-box-containing protein
VALLFAILEGLPFRVQAYDLTLRCVLQNQVSIRDFGSLIGRHISELPTPRESVERWQRQAQQALAGNVAWDEFDVNVNGDLRTYRCLIAPICTDGDIRGAVGVDVDITRQRRTELALRESEERFRQMAETLPLVMWESDSKTWDVQYIGPQAVSLLGYSLECWREPNFWIEHVAPEDRERVARTSRERTATDDHFGFEYRMIAADGRKVWVQDYVNVMRSAGQPVRLRGFLIDISARKQAEEALRESEARYRLLADHSTDIIGRHAPSGQWLYASPATRSVLGREPAELIGKDPFEIIHPDDRAEALSKLDEMRRTGETQTALLRVRRKDGRYIWLEAAGRAVLDPVTNQMTEVVATMRDVTERIDAHHKLRQREGELAHLDRLSTMGQMASELAHELSQPLYAITNFAEACLGIVDRPGELNRDELRQRLTQLSQQARRGGDVLRRVTQFVRKGELRRQPLDLNQSVRDVASMLDSELRRHSVQLRLELADTPQVVDADALLMEQVLVNLIRNAEEAMDAKPPGQRLLMVRTFRNSSGEIGAAVSDSGVGLTPENFPRLFESYFTTKPQGTGLGLPICRTTIEAHRGRIWASNNPTGGATFQFVLPAAESVPAAAAQPAVSA